MHLLLPLSLFTVLCLVPTIEMYHTVWRAQRANLKFYEATKICKRSIFERWTMRNPFRLALSLAKSLGRRDRHSDLVSYIAPSWICDESLTNKAEFFFWMVTHIINFFLLLTYVSGNKWQQVIRLFEWFEDLTNNIYLLHFFKYFID